MITFTTIIHSFRKENGLSPLEYIFLDIVYMFQNNPNSRFKGWCYAKKETLAEELGISRMGLYKIIERMKDEGFLVQNGSNGYIQTTQKWNKVYFPNEEKSVNKVYKERKQSLHEDVNKVYTERKQSLHREYINDNTLIREDIKENIPQKNQNENIEVENGVSEPDLFAESKSLETKFENNEVSYLEIRKYYAFLHYKNTPELFKKSISENVFNDYKMLILLFEPYSAQISKINFITIDSFKNELYGKFTPLELKLGAEKMLSLGVRQNMNMLLRLKDCIEFATNRSKSNNTACRPDESKTYNVTKEKQNMYENSTGKFK